MRLGDFAISGSTGASSLAKNPLALLVIAQATFLFIGIEFLAFSTTWTNVAFTTLSAVILELLFANASYLRGNESSPRIFVPTSAMAAAFGIAIFLRALDPWYFALAGAIAIASKYVIKAHGRHIFNPSNFAVTSLAVLLPFATTIEFSQWGDSPFVALGVAAVCFFIAYRAGALPTTLSFFGAYTVVLLALFAFSPDAIAAHHLGLLGPSLVLFASFMITDPRTSPTSGIARYWHGAGVAFLYFFLEVLGVRYALFISSFLTAALGFMARSLGSSRLSVPTAPVTIIALLLLVAGSYVQLRHLSPSLDIRDISPGFLLFGLESNGVYRCSDTASYTEQHATGVEHTASTYGGSWGDYDNDGFLDLYIANRGNASSRLNRNLGNGTFKDVTESAGLPRHYSSSGLFFDYDNDADLDLAVSFIDPLDPKRGTSLRIFENESGRFSDVSHIVRRSAAENAVGNGYLSSADYDGDGRLDLVHVTDGEFYNPGSLIARAFERTRRDPFYVGKRSVHVMCGARAVTDVLERFPSSYSDRQRTYLQNSPVYVNRQSCIFYSSRFNILPESVAGAEQDTSILFQTILSPGAAILYHNQDGLFEPIKSFSDTVARTVEQNVDKRVLTNKESALATGRFFQPISFDYDADGLQDIFMAVDFGRNVLLKNRGNLQFSDETLSAGMDYQGSGMGADVSDWDGDGDPDIVVSNVGADYLFENRGDGTFENRFKEMNLSVNNVGWGIAFVDFDGDGRDDILTANGAIADYSSDEATRSALTRPVFRTNTLYRNSDGKQLQNVTGHQMCSGALNGKALAIADYDNDGDPDFFFGTILNGNSLWENTGSERYLRIHLEGSRSNRMGVGAKVSVTVGGMTQTKWMIAGDSFASQSERLVFALGDENEARVRVEWPSGLVTEDIISDAGDSVIAER